MEKLYKLITYAFAITAAVTGFSYSNSDQCGSCDPAPKCDPCDPCEPCEQCEPCPWQGYEAKDLKGGYNAPGRIEICGEWDFFLKADYILWQPREEGIELGTYQYQAGGSAGKVINQNFKFKSGFQVGIGGHSDDDDWTLALNYIWLRGTHKKSTTGDNFHPSLQSAALSVSAASQKWKPRFDILDFDWGRSYYMGKAVIFKPYVGGRAYWLGQKLRQNFRYAGDNHDTTPKVKSTSWAFGARAGVDTNWILDEGFRVFGNAAASLAYQKIKTRYTEYTGSTLNHNYRDKVGQITPNGELELGLGWGTYIDENRWHIDLTASYIFQVFWNQNSIRDLANIASDIGTDVPHGASKGDLMLQGLTVSAKLDF